ncbi:MAG: cupin domain-containing protein [Halieaceae bacterium]|jgi:quercetin dioxygenase-like cupin family protein|nr:cupin domain-containing protein [Halieaceae bacterium]
MTDQSLIKNAKEYPWEYEIGEEGRDDVIRWRTFLASDKTPSQGISMGVLEIPPGAVLGAHHHSPIEVYYITSGEGQCLCGDTVKPVCTGDVVYIPADEVHGIKNISDQLLVLEWVFACDSWYDIKYHDDEVSFF